MKRFLLKITAAVAIGLFVASGIVGCAKEETKPGRNEATDVTYKCAMAGCTKGTKTLPANSAGVPSC